MFYQIAAYIGKASYRIWKKNMSIDILVGIRVLEFIREKRDLSQNHHEGFTRSKLSKNSSSDIFF